MTEEELIDMARKSGFVDYELDDGTTNAFDKRYEAFAKLVAEAEREACAKIVEESSLPDTYSEECLPDIANEIRARGDKNDI